MAHPTQIGPREFVLPPPAPIDPSARIAGDRYNLTEEEIKSFHAKGYITLSGIVTPAELEEVATTYLALVNRQIVPPDNWGGYDYGDHSQPDGTPEERWRMVNCTLPTVHHAAWRGNIFERRAKSIADQLYGPGMVWDYDQLLAKKPNKGDAEFAWHQDAGYWWATGDDTPTRTATVSLAINDADVDNGCLRVVPGSHKSASVRPHRDVVAPGADKDQHHLLQLDLQENEFVEYLPVRAGDCTVHDEWIVHGSGGNRTDRWRHTYVVAFRDERMVAFERSKGFRHSYCDRDALELLRTSIKDRSA